MTEKSHPGVIPAQAGIPAFAGMTEKSHSGVIPAQAGIPAFAGMTMVGVLEKSKKNPSLKKLFQQCGKY
jgi:uncharacterized protein YdhG (YjbR/CyaY superfamily)